MNKYFLLALLALAGCADCEGISEDEQVFLDSVAQSCTNYKRSPSLRAQYGRWKKGEITLDGSAKRAKEAQDTADTAFIIGVMNMGSK